MAKTITIKEEICAVIGMFGSAIASAFGGWDTGIATLIIFMAIDYASGVTVAAVFKKSPKTQDGKLASSAGFKGLCKKGMEIFFVLIAYRLDLLIGTTYIRDCVVMGFVSNELISIMEQAVLMGIPLPKIITKALEILSQKAEKTEQ